MSWRISSFARIPTRKSWRWKETQFFSSSACASMGHIFFITTYNMMLRAVCVYFSNVGSDWKKRFANAICAFSVPPTRKVLVLCSLSRRQEMSNRRRI